MEPRRRLRIPLIWHGSAAIARVVEISADVVRGTVVLAVAIGVLLTLVGTASQGSRETRLNLPESAAAAPDSMVFLLGRSDVPADEPSRSLLAPLRPTSLLAGTFRTAGDSLTERVRRLVSTPSGCRRRAGSPATSPVAATTCCSTWSDPTRGSMSVPWWAPRSRRRLRGPW